MIRYADSSLPMHQKTNYFIKDGETTKNWVGRNC